MPPLIMPSTSKTLLARLRVEVADTTPALAWRKPVSEPSVRLARVVEPVETKLPVVVAFVVVELVAVTFVAKKSLTVAVSAVKMLVKKLVLVALAVTRFVEKKLVDDAFRTSELVANIKLVVAVVVVRPVNTVELADAIGFQLVPLNAYAVLSEVLK